MMLHVAGLSWHVKNQYRSNMNVFGAQAGSVYPGESSAKQIFQPDTIKKPQRRSLLYACAIFFRDHTGLGLVGFECKSRTIELWVGLRLGDQCLADSSYWLVRLHPVR